MKPDKHKQKRSQQYKKKHGVHTEKAKNDASKLVEINKLKNDLRRSHDDVDETHIKSAVVCDYDSNESVNEDDKRISPKSTVLPSNWDRYEEPTEKDDEISSRGADFSLLLQRQSSAVSQFRFADELALDDDVKDKGEPCLLTFDMDELISALACIPLHKKLNIEEKYFNKEDIAFFNEEAKRGQKLFEQKKKQVKSKCRQPERESESRSRDQADSAADLDPENVLSNSEGNNLSVEKRHSFMMDEAKDVGVPQEMLEDLDEILLGKRTEDSGNVVHDSCAKQEAEQETSDDHDFSELDEEASVTTVGNKTGAKVTENTKCMTNIEDDLDKLLSFDDTSTEVNDVKMKAEKIVSDDLLLTDDELNELLNSIMGD